MALSPNAGLKPADFMEEGNIVHSVRMALSPNAGLKPIRLCSPAH